MNYPLISRTINLAVSHPFSTACPVHSREEGQRAAINHQQVAAARGFAAPHPNVCAQNSALAVWHSLFKGAQAVPCQWYPHLASPTSRGAALASSPVWQQPQPPHCALPCPALKPHPSS